MPSWKNYLAEESVAYYASLELDKVFAFACIPSWVYAPRVLVPFSGCSSSIEIDALFDAGDHIHYVAMVELLYVMVCQNITEVDPLFRVSIKTNERTFVVLFTGTSRSSPTSSLTTILT